MFSRNRRPRIASLCLGAVVASFGATSAHAANPDVTKGSLFPSSQPEVIKQTAVTLQEIHREGLPQLINDAVSITSRRYLTADVHTPWQIMHGLLALRDEYKIKVNGEKVSALNWLTERRYYKGQPIIEHTPYGGRFHTFTEPYAFEGHPNQFLAIATMSELTVDFAFKTTVGGQVTIQDMINNAKADVNDREEITWTLWALSRYLPVDSEWISADGEPWSIERLVQIQTYANPDEAACGGTHGLFALSLARNSYLATGKPLRGIWLEADQKVKRFIAKAKSLQNEDGTFSTEYFKGPGASSDFGKRIATSGHILEFLMVAAHDDQLQQEWMQKAVFAVANDLVENRKEAADCGPLYHALHALVLYRQRAGIQPADARIVQGTPKKAATDKPADPAVSPSDVKPELTNADPAKPARIDAGNAKRIDDVPLLKKVAPLAKRESDLQVRPLSNTEPQAEKAEPKTGEPSTFDNVVAKPIVPTKPTSEADSQTEPATESVSTETDDGNLKSDDAEETQKVIYRQPEENAYTGTDGGPGSENASEIPLPPTED
ncbi:MAG: hypothetical protein HQ518_29615 [Rhodopirellula sp.]|nr:hypothetical protein [Rhodopirellula sp.]